MTHVPNNNGVSSFGTKANDEMAHAPAVTPYVRRGHVIEKWIKKLYTKSNVTKVPEKEVVPTTNSFLGLERINIEEKREDGEIWEDASEALGESHHGPSLSRPEITSHGPMVIAGKLNVTNLDGFQVISKDFSRRNGENRDLGLLRADDDVKGLLAMEL
ncbi:hypothetical protein LIER_18882 [Lithospermum erythrorhizon]|uniref:Uncharacterized protein n=1 Tax=Lithospermum erythrorhizon TaxID=34254 RepID=A0AAV3QL24_LITER